MRDAIELTVLGKSAEEQKPRELPSLLTTRIIADSGERWSEGGNLRSILLSLISGGDLSSYCTFISKSIRFQNKSIAMDVCVQHYLNGRARWEFAEKECGCSDGVFFAYEVSSESSFKRLSNFIEAMRQSKKLLPPFILIGLDGGRERQVPNETGRALAKKYGVPFFECSETTTGEAITAMLVALAGEIAKKPPRVKSDEVKPNESSCVLM